MKPIWRITLWIVRQLFGWFFIVLGLAGIILPGMPGWIFIGLGVLLLADDIAIFRRLIHGVERRWPQTRWTIRTARGWLGRRDGCVREVGAQGGSVDHNSEIPRPHERVAVDESGRGGSE